MGAYLGDTEIGQMFLGSTEIGQAYLGSTKVWEKGGVTPPQPLPYDAEIEYLESNGTQRIDTGIVANASTEINWSAAFLGTGGNYQVLVGAAGNSIYSFVCVYNKGTKKCYLQYGTTGSLYVEKALTNGVRYDFNFVAENNKATLTIDTTRGVLTTTNTFSDKNIHLFANHNGNSGANARIYNISITNGANVLFDAIPVRVGQVGYMYDKVSGQLFGNAGTGSFTLGNDITT